MSRFCSRCGKRCACFSRPRYCRVCYQRFIENSEHVDLPEDHPWVMERRRRLERMHERAEHGLPIFEEVHADLC